MRVALLALLAALVPALCAACGGEPPVLSEDDVLEKLAPSMVTVQFRSVDTGSGFLVEGNYVVTASHAVWGLSAIGIDLIFESGTVHENVPVAAYDHFTEIAFLGPIDTSAPHVKLTEADTLPAGDTTYIVGDPFGPGGFSAGVGQLHSTRDWQETDSEWVYSTAAYRDGMRGGPITNKDGEVMGVLIRRIGEDYSWGPSSETIRDRLEKLERGEDVSVLGNREIPDAREGSQEFEFLLRDRWDTATFVSVGSNHNLEFDSYRDVQYGFFNVDGTGAFKPDFRTVQDWFTHPCCLKGPGFVEVRQPFDIERHVRLRSLTPLMRLDDPDDGRALQIGGAIAGAIDTPGDIDRYTIDLFAGERIDLRLTSINSLLVTIDYPQAAPYEIASEEVYLGRINYRAPVNATYTVALQMTPERFASPLGYTLTADNSSAEPDQPDRSAVLDSPVGEMLRHVFDHSVPTIRVDYPFNISGGDREVIAADLFEQDRWGRTVTLEKRDLNQYRRQPDEELSVDDYMERSVLSSTFPYKGEKIVTARREVATPSGALVLIEDFEVDDGGMKGVRLAYIHEGETGFMAIFYAPGEVFDEWRPVVDYCIGTFSVGDFSVADAMSDE